MDEKIRRLQRSYLNSGSTEATAQYIHALEQLVGLQPKPPKVLVSPDDKTWPCLICDKPMENTAQEPWLSPQEDRRSIPAYGTFTGKPKDGSGVVTCINNSDNLTQIAYTTLHFCICDECVIRHGHKIISYDSFEEIENVRHILDEWWKGYNDYPEIKSCRLDAETENKLTQWFKD